jgi:23S rRNA (uracil1939-C5)-methyltransferase
MALHRGQEIDLTVDGLAFGGRGVARHGELVVFVSRALPGDRVRARITKLKRRHAEAFAVEVLEAGPGRVAPRCSHFGVCGGCAWQDLDYAEQVRHKAAQVDDALLRLGRLEIELEPIVPAAQQYAYRNKLEYSWSAGPDGASLGFHRAGRWDELVPVETCHIASPAGNDVRRAFERWARDAGLVAYDGRTGGGYLRHLVVREGAHTGQLLAMLVTAPGPVPDPERLRALMPAAVVGAVHAENAGVGEATAGLEPKPLFGADRYEEVVGGLRLSVTAGAFMQTNTVMSERLYELAIGYAGLSEADVAWDLYCGAGAIGLLAAARAGRVYGIEIAEESVARARENAQRNGIANIEFVAGDVAKSVAPLLERAPRPDVVFVDPPRAGLTPKAVKRLLELAPERIVYVSCNPTTLAPNARSLVDAGYALERARPVDMFPHTPHIECVALLRRQAHHSRATASST